MKAREVIRVLSLISLVVLFTGSNFILGTPLSPEIAEAQTSSINTPILLRKITAMSMGNSTQQCESCPMKASSEAQSHFVVTDGSGSIHYVDCFMCALELVPKYDQLHIETYCDCYGPSYKITIDVSQHGNLVVVKPSTVLWLNGGGCTGNRIAMNQTAADFLLSKGFSQYTMMMQRQSLPSGTKVMKISEAALMYTKTDTTENKSSPLMLYSLVAIGMGVFLTAVIYYKKFNK